MRYILLIIFMISLVNSKEFKNPLSKNIKLSLRDYNQANMLRNNQQKMLSKNIISSDYILARTIEKKEYFSAIKEDLFAEDLELNNLEINHVIKIKGRRLTILINPLNDYKEAEQTIEYEYIQVEINSFSPLLDDYLFANKLLKEEDKLIQEELEYYK